MKYMESGGFQGHPLMRLTLSLTLAFLLLFWATNFALYFSKMDLRPASVVSYYNGSEEEFRPARTFGSMVEVTHAHLAMMALVLLLLTHLVIFAPLPKGAKVGLITGAFGAALLDEAGGFLVRFVSPRLALLKVVGFVSLQALLVFLMGSLAWSLLRPARRANGGSSALIGLILVLVWATAASAQEAREARRVRSYYVMGTLLELEAAGPEPVLDGALDAAYREVERVDLSLSLYRPESELSRLNQKAAASPFPLSDIAFEVLEGALAVASASGGAFDPTVGPLVELWGRGRVPGTRDLRVALAKVGYRKVQLDRERHTVRFRAAAVRLDLNGIAKGYAVDRALATLRAAGVREVWVTLGESSLGSYGAPCVVAIREPFQPERTERSFRLSDGTVSTSGTYGKGFEHEGRWYSHLLDPRSGWPPKRSVSATVVAREGQAMLADALSTAGIVLGPEEAICLWQNFGVEGALLLRDGGSLKWLSTSGFPVEPAR